VVAGASGEAAAAAPPPALVLAPPPPLLPLLPLLTRTAAASQARGLVRAPKPSAQRACQTDSLSAAARSRVQQEPTASTSRGRRRRSTCASTSAGSWCSGRLGGGSAAPPSSERSASPASAAAAAGAAAGDSPALCPALVRRFSGGRAADCSSRRGGEAPSCGVGSACCPVLEPLVRRAADQARERAGGLP